MSVDRLTTTDVSDAVRSAKDALHHYWRQIVLLTGALGLASCATGPVGSSTVASPTRAETGAMVDIPDTATSPRKLMRLDLNTNPQDIAVFEVFKTFAPDGVGEAVTSDKSFKVTLPQGETFYATQIPNTNLDPSDPGYKDPDNHSLLLALNDGAGITAGWPTYELEGDYFYARYTKPGENFVFGLAYPRYGGPVEVVLNGVHTPTTLISEAVKIQDPMQTPRFVDVNNVPYGSLFEAMDTQMGQVPEAIPTLPPTVLPTETRVPTMTPTVESSSTATMPSATPTPEATATPAPGLVDTNTYEQILGTEAGEIICLPERCMEGMLTLESVQGQQFFYDLVWSWAQVESNRILLTEQGFNTNSYEEYMNSIAEHGGQMPAGLLPPTEGPQVNDFTFQYLDRGLPTFNVYGGAFEVLTNEQRLNILYKEGGDESIEQWRLLTPRVIESTGALFQYGVTTTKGVNGTNYLRVIVALGADPHGHDAFPYPDNGPNADRLLQRLNGVLYNFIRLPFRISDEVDLTKKINIFTPSTDIDGGLGPNLQDRPDVPYIFKLSKLPQ